MATTPFSSSVLATKLKELQNTIHSIQTLSLWLIHHRRHAKHVADIWMKEFQRLSGSRQLALMYLANDVIQNSKRKGPEYGVEYERVLPKAFKVVHKSRDHQIKKAVHRMLNVWEQRNVFDELFINELRVVLGDDVKTEEIEAKKLKLERALSLEEIPTEVKPPDVESMLKRVSILFNMEKQQKNLKVQQNIDATYSVVMATGSTANITEPSEAERLFKHVDELVVMLSEQRSALTERVTEREHLDTQLTTSIHHHRKQVKSSEHTLEETKQKLEKVNLLKEDLKVHLGRLPDLSKLTSVEFAPLPAVGELFN